MPKFEAVDFYNLEELLTADERRIRAAVRQWVQERFLPVVTQHYRDGTFPMELVPEMAKLGVFGPSIKGYGCPGLGSVAAGLVDGMVTPLQFKEERVLDKALIPIMDKVKVVPNEEFEALFPKFQPSRVTITTNDGKSHSTRVDVPKGDPRDPMTEEEIAVKFTALGGDVIGRDQCKKLQKLIMSMETAKNLGGLFELTTAR